MSKDDAIAREPGLSYSAAGVDIAAGNRLVDAIKPLARATARAGSTADLGGFGAFFDLKAAGFSDPILVAANDGVGTKLKIAIATARHDTVGIDLVAMCANDLVVQGAEPLFFLDYFAAGRLDVDTARSIVEGIAEGCRQAGCALIGGETAEMPDMYAGDDYDLAGFVVGAVERDRMLTGAGIAAGDVLLGIASSGLHSNGFSLVRKLVSKQGLAYSDAAPFDRQLPLGEALLAPTRIYVRSCLEALRYGGITGLAHITGGGLVENVPRVLPAGVAAEIDCGSWEVPPVFDWIAAEVEPAEMVRTFNCGLGMVAVVRASDSARIRETLQAAGETVFEIGRVTERREGDAPFRLMGLEVMWRG